MRVLYTYNYVYNYIIFVFDLMRFLCVCPTPSVLLCFVWNFLGVFGFVWFICVCMDRTSNRIVIMRHSQYCTKTIIFFSIYHKLKQHSFILALIIIFILSVVRCDGMRFFLTYRTCDKASACLAPHYLELTHSWGKSVVFITERERASESACFFHLLIN